MKSGFDMLDNAYSVLQASGIVEDISGNMYLLERPKNSKLEDIVLNALPITGDQLQRGVFNVNFHAPNRSDVVINDVADETQPDIDRLKDIGNQIVEIMRDVIGNDYHFNVSTGGYPIRDNDGTWYFNIRVDYYSVQPNFTNI